MTKRDRQLAEYRAERFFLACPRVEDRLVVCFEDESHFDTDRRNVRRGVGGIWERGGWQSYMADDEWETLDFPESRRLEAEYQRLVKAGKVEDIDEMLERPEWRSVDDELPDFGQTVILDLGFGAVGVGAFEGDKTPCGKPLCRYIGWGLMPAKHWMPLPKRKRRATVEDCT
jgi:hypothetical protein